MVTGAPSIHLMLTWAILSFFSSAFLFAWRGLFSLRYFMLAVYFFVTGVALLLSTIVIIVVKVVA